MESMKIAQVISGNLPILPTGKRGWGAVELLMDEYTKCLRTLGNTCDIRWLNEVGVGQYDIAHIHVANLCIEAQKRGLPYIYSNHDHSSYHLGKNSFGYRQQLEAIKGSIFSITHAEYVIDYFDDTDKLFYLQHGVDTSYYTPNLNLDTTQHKLLIVSNNGLCGDQSFDRKGFIYGIEAAKRLNLPITIVGADANREFFEIHSHLLEYENLNVICNNPSEDEKLKIFQEHTIFLHPSMLEFGVPCLAQVEAAGCCLPIVGTYSGSREIKGLYALDSLSTESVVDGIIWSMGNYDSLRKEMMDVRLIYDWMHVSKKLDKMYRNALNVNELYDSNRTRDLYKNTYNTTIKQNA